MNNRRIQSEQQPKMARRYVTMRLLVALPVLLLLSALPVSLAAPKKVAASARKEDIPFIKCQVCEKLAQQLYHQIQKKGAEIAPKKVSELQMIEIAERVCNLKKQEADWILQIDIVEKGDALKLVDQDTEGQCNTECKTIEHACQQVMGYSDTDIAEYIYSKKPSIDSLVNYICYDLSKACSVKPPTVPKNRAPGEPFVPKSSKEAEMERVLESMEGMPGAPGMKMYSREDLMNMNTFGHEDDEDDGEDDDDDKFPSQLGKVFREKESGKRNLKERVLLWTKSTGNTIKQHVNRVSNQVKRWWRKKKGSKQAKAGKSEL